MRRARSRTCACTFSSRHWCWLATLVLRLDRVYVIATVAFGCARAQHGVDEHRDRVDRRLADRRASSAGQRAPKMQRRARCSIAAIGAVLGRLFDLLSGHHERRGPRFYRGAKRCRPTWRLIVLAVVAIATIFAKAWIGRGSALQGGAVSGHAALAFAVATMLAFFTRSRLPPSWHISWPSWLPRAAWRRRSTAPSRSSGEPYSARSSPWRSTCWCGLTLCYNGADLNTDPVRSSPDGLPYESIALVVLVLLAAFFAASEAALVSISRLRARAIADRRVRGASDLQTLVDDKNRFLTSILVGNTIVLLAADSLATYIAISLGLPSAAVISTIVNDGRLFAFRRDHPQDHRHRR